MKQILNLTIIRNFAALLYRRRARRLYALLALLPFCLLTLFVGCKKNDPNDGTFTVSFAANGGSGTMANQTFTEGVAQALTLNTFSHTTLHFNGWATSASGDVVYTDGQSIMVTSNLKLYAKWSSSITTGTPCPGMPTVTDCQGNVYNTVQIGTQCWTKQNLKATKYDTKSERPNVMLSTSADYVYTPYYTVSTLSHTQAGNLYNWAAAVALTDGTSQTTEFSTKRQGICPNGWHVPTDAEWTMMQNYLVANGYNYDGSTSGNKIAKSLVEVSPGNKGTWNSFAGEGYPGSTTDSGEPKRNATGFSALPAGYAYGSNVNYVGYNAYFWSASAGAGNFAWYRFLYNFNADFIRSNYNKYRGFSVRCLRD